jgi:hypothetical protein
VGCGLKSALNGAIEVSILAALAKLKVLPPLLGLQVSEGLCQWMIVDAAEGCVGGRVW